MRLVPIVYSAVATAVIGGSAVLLPTASAQAAQTAHIAQTAHAAQTAVRHPDSLLSTLTCQGTDFTSFSSPLTTTPTSTLIFSNDTFGPCVSTDTSISGAVAYSQTSVPNATCDSLLSGGSGQTTFFWSNGSNSTFSYTRATVEVNGEIVATETGTITSGEFAGNIATEVLAEPTLDLTACENGGLSSASGTATLEILPL
jgi:hypothetical protein